jgi:predicted AAA+ superfamily ATPase
MIFRDASTRLLDLRADFPVVLVSGARQVGKTTLVRLLADRLKLAQSVNLDHSGTRERAAEDPELFVDDFKPQAHFGLVAGGMKEPFLITDRVAAVPFGWLLT